MLNIGHKIKKLRELKNYTQEYMAQNLGLTPAGYNKIEREETDISVNRLADIAKILEVDISTIWHFDENKIFNITHSHQNAIGNYQARIYNNDKLVEHLEKEISYLRNENSKLVEKLGK